MMSEVPGFFASFSAGLLSFVSPCVLPLIPVYLSFISGESLEETDENSPRQKLKLFIRTLYFVLGFTIVFVVFSLVLRAGINFAGVALSIRLKKIAGAIIILLGLNTMLDFIPFLRQEKRGQAHQLKSNVAGSLRSVLFGMLFAAGWTPCIGPILATILLYAGQADSSVHSISLLVAYSLGLGLPFILTGLFINQITPLLDFLKQKGFAVKIISGVLIIGFGLAMLTGRL